MGPEPAVGAGLEGFEPAVGAGPYKTVESDWNAYNIPTPIFYATVHGKGTDIRLLLTDRTSTLYRDSDG